MRPTITDIASRAGVSKTTVSFALNDPSRISAETNSRIMAIVAELDHVPDPVARTLTTKRLGLSIPGDLSVAGFDDIPEAARAKPALTAVHQPGKGKGSAAGGLVVSLLAGGKPGHLTLPASLVVRESCSEPRRRELRIGMRE